MKKIRLRKWQKVVLITFGSIFLVLLGGVIYTNYIISTIIKEKLNERLIAVHGKTLEYGAIRVNILRQSVSVYNIYYSSVVNGAPTMNEEGFDVMIKKISIDNIDILNVLKTKNLIINNIDIHEPFYRVHIGKTEEKENAEMSDVEGSRKILELIASLNVDYVDIINAKFELASISSKLRLTADSIDISVNDLKYNLVDSTLNYNDSVYNFHIRNIRMLQPNGNYELSIKSLKTENEGALVFSGLRYVCLVPKNKVAELNGNVPTAWNDINLDEIRTNKCNIIRKVLAKKIDIDSLMIQGNYILVYKDNIPPPTKVRQMLQQSIMGIKEPVDFKYIGIKLPQLIYQEIDKNTGVGEIELDYLNININNFNNQSNSTIYINATGSIRNGGTMNINLDLDMNERCSFRCKAILDECDGTAFNPFVVPIVGAEIKRCMIDYVYTRFSGDTSSTNGIFTMAYHGFNAKLLKGESPYLILAKNSGAINFVSKLIIPEANPKKGNEEPQSFTVNYKRNKYKPFGNYLVMTLLDGVKKTLIPGMYLNNQVRITESITELSKLDKQAKEKRREREKNSPGKKVERLNKKLIQLNKKLDEIKNENRKREVGRPTSSTF